jgi:3-hydroxyacyl-[acyl-carrier-protein] dehydratase
MLNISPEIAALFRHAEKTPLLPPALAPVLDRATIEALIPHRDPFLLLDEVYFFDLPNGLIAARYDLERARDVLAGHFPGHPVWPGVLQVEAIGQAACVLHARRGHDGATNVAATHILGARFLRPITPMGAVEIVAQVVEDGLFFTAVGQCFQHQKLCCVAAISALA